MKRSQGFTVIELITAIAILLLLGAVAILQKNDIDASARDQTRKTAVNAFYYGLKEGYFTQHKSYPPAISKENLPYIDTALFTDPDDKKIGATGSDYHYRPLDCVGSNCKKFVLSADLEKEADYTKKSSDN